MIDIFFKYLEQIIGQPQDQIRLVTCWIMSIPLGYMNRYIKRSDARHFYSLSLGLFLSYVCLEVYALIPIFASMGTYIIAKIYQRKCDWPSFYFLFILMTVYNTYRYFTDFYGWRLDGSISLMMMICKMTYFTFGYSEGKIKKMPSFIEFQSYIFFYPSAIMGPVYDYQTFDDYIHLRKQYADKYPVVRRSLTQLALGIGFITVLVLYLPVYNHKFYFTDEYRSLPWWNKLLWTMFISPILRCKFLGGWKICQAGIDACGMNYNGKDSEGKPRYDKILVMKNDIEHRNNPKLKTEAWNSSVQVWLKDTFYRRFRQKYSKYQSLSIVFLISAFWHGIHPAYYMGFFYWALSIVTSWEFYKKKDNFNKINPVIQRIFVEIFGFLSFQQIGMTVSILDMNQIMELEQGFNYIPMIWPIILFALIKSPILKYNKELPQKVTNVNEKKQTLYTKNDYILTKDVKQRLIQEKETECSSENSSEK